MCALSSPVNKVKASLRLGNETSPCRDMYLCTPTAGYTCTNPVHVLAGNHPLDGVCADLGTQELRGGEVHSSHKIYAPIQKLGLAHLVLSQKDAVLDGRICVVSCGQSVGIKKNKR